MQLEFKPANIINRLTKFQTILGAGEVVNAERLENRIGYDFAFNKSQHQKLIVLTKEKLEKAN